MDQDGRQIWRQDLHADRELIGSETLVASMAIFITLGIAYLMHWRYVTKSSPRIPKSRFDEIKFSEDTLDVSSAARSKISKTRSDKTILSGDTLEFFPDEDITPERSIVNYFTPVMASIKGSSQASITDTQSMSKVLARKISKDIKKESWAQGQEVVVNQDTNTISVFATDQHGQVDTKGIIPLTYQDVCVIPHPFANFEPSLCPAELNDPTEQIPNGLSDDQIRRFYNYFPGLVSLTYFLDKRVVIKVANSMYQPAVEKIGGTAFKAWTFTVLLLYTSSTNLEDEVKTSLPIGPSESCLPGSNIFNLENCFSTLGVYLKSKPRTDENEVKVDHFTISAHSFLSKKSFDLGFHTDSLWLIPFITNLAFLGLYSPIFPFLLIQQYLSVRLTVSMIHICWKYIGCRLQLHSVRGRIKIKMGITNFGLTLIYIIPTLGRIAIIWIVQGTIMNLITFLPEFAWLHNSLSMESHNTIIASFEYIWNYVPLILEMSLMSLLFKNLRMLIEGYVSPIRMIQPSQMVNKWMTATIRNREGMYGSLTFPYRIFFFLALFCRYVISYGCLKITENSIRLAGLLFLMWDLFFFICSFDFPWTYKLVGQPVLTLSHGLVGRVVNSFESLSSMTSPQVWKNDLAVAQFSKSIFLPSYRAIEWEDGALPMNTKLYLLGRKTEGHFDSRDTPDVIQGPVQGIIGGWQYIMNVASHTHAAEYATALIWRCKDVTIIGDSGSLLVHITDGGDGKYNVHGVAFQSHELPINPVGIKPQLYWKIAFRPPIELRDRYWALAPADMMDSLAKKTRQLQDFTKPVCADTPESVEELTIGQFADDFIRRDMLCHQDS